MLLYCIKSDKHGYLNEGSWYEVESSAYSAECYTCIDIDNNQDSSIYRDRLEEFFDLNNSQKPKPKLYLVR